MNYFKLLSPVLLFFFSCSNIENTTGQSRESDKLKSDANVAYKEKDYRRALLLYDQLLQSDSSNGEYYFRRAYSYSSLFNVAEAVRDYKKAIERGHNVAEAYKNIGINYCRVNDSLAVVYFNMALKAGSTDPQILNRIAECRKRFNNFKN
jgi:tetratricopeptide (TPR) repeat protein